MDILFRQEGTVFSYRVAGVLIRDGKILLQKPKKGGYGIIGGHLQAQELSREALVREFKEETHADIAVDDLMAVGEIFFTWREQHWHQIALYYKVHLTDETSIPLDGVFSGVDELEDWTIDMDYCWIPLEGLKDLYVHPPQLIPHILSGSEEVLHFVYTE